MNSLRFEYKSLAVITVIGFTANLVFAIIGFSLPNISPGQLFCYQVGDASAIMASVIAARYTGLRGLHVAASAFILLGITHGLSLASSGLESFNVEKGITVIMPMVPSMLLLSWCTIFPIWLRCFVVLPLFFFIYVYVHVINGGTYYDAPLALAYISWVLVEIFWSYYIYRDWKKIRTTL